MIERVVYVLENGQGEPVQSAIDPKRVKPRKGTSLRVVKYVPERYKLAAEELLDHAVKLQAEPASLAAKVSALEAELDKLKTVVDAGNRLAQAVICCALHTWQNIPVQSKVLAVTMGCRMYEYIEVSPYFEWPEADPGRFEPKTREQLREQLTEARKRQI